MFDGHQNRHPPGKETGMKLARFTNTLTFDLLILVGIIFASIAVGVIATIGGVIA